jgi:hypothetical protein
MVSKSGRSWSASQAEHGQRAEWSIVSELSNEPCRASSVSLPDGQAEYWQWAKWSIVTGASELSGVPTAEYRAEWSISTGVTSWTEHHQSAERSTVSERSRVMSASRAEHRQRAVRSTISESPRVSPRQALVARLRCEMISAGAVSVAAVAFAAT